MTEWKRLEPMESSDGVWRVRRDPRVTLELSRVGLVSDGMPFLAGFGPLETK